MGLIRTRGSSWNIHGQNVSPGSSPASRFTLSVSVHPGKRYLNLGSTYVPLSFLASFLSIFVRKLQQNGSKSLFLQFLDIFGKTYYYVKLPHEYSTSFSSQNSLYSLVQWLLVKAPLSDVCNFWLTFATTDWRLNLRLTPYSSNWHMQLQIYVQHLRVAFTTPIDIRGFWFSLMYAASGWPPH